MHFIVHAVRFVIENGPWTVAGAAVTVAVLYLLVAPSVPVGRCTGVGELEGIWGILGFKCLGGRVAYTEPELFAFIAAGLIVFGGFVGAVIGALFNSGPASKVE